MNDLCRLSSLFRRGCETIRQDRTDLLYARKGRPQNSTITFVHIAFLASCFAFVSSQQETPFRLAALIQTSTTCDADKRTAMPCSCCKLDCWHAVVDVVSMELGHIPGAESDAETRATLQAVRSCMIAGCQKTCSDDSKARRRNSARYYEEIIANALAAAADAV